MTYKHWLIIAIILALFAINIYCNNIIINTLSYLSYLPKIIAITIAGLFLLFPRFMNDVDFHQFIPKNPIKTNPTYTPYTPNISNATYNSVK